MDAPYYNGEPNQEMYRYPSRKAEREESFEECYCPICKAERERPREAEPEKTQTEAA